MSDTALWSAAFLLVGAGVAADGYLVWMSVHGWRKDRLARRAQRDAAKRSALRASMPSKESSRMRTWAGFATLGLTACIATAQEPATQPTNTTTTIRAAQPDATAPTPAPAPVTPAPPVPAEAIGSAFSLQFNVDFTNAYYYRGIRQQDKGLIVQPAARLTVNFIDDTDLKLDGFVGMWNSFGSNPGTQTGDLAKDWYEADLYAGFTATHGKLSLTTSYTFLTSPSDAFETVQELGFTLALDDSEWLKEFALKPYTTLVFETGADASDGAESDTGTYLELGIAPGFAFDVGSTPVTLTFPVSVGLSLEDYYQDAAGDDNTFGFAQVGVKASFPLGKPGRFGAWTLNASVSVLFLGDNNTNVFNNGDETEVIGTVGLQLNF